MAGSFPGHCADLRSIITLDEEARLSTNCTQDIPILNTPSPTLHPNTPNIQLRGKIYKAVVGTTRSRFSPRSPPRYEPVSSEDLEIDLGLLAVRCYPIPFENKLSSTLLEVDTLTETLGEEDRLRILAGLGSGDKLYMKVLWIFA